MKRRPKQVLQEENPALVASDGEPLVQIKVWLLGVSPMVWRRVLVPADCTLRELHGVFQVAMGSESTVNAVISKRFAKRQQMQWTKPGAHLLLQMRTRALDGTLRPQFERWYPDLANDIAPGHPQHAAA